MCTALASSPAFVIPTATGPCPLHCEPGSLGSLYAHLPLILGSHGGEDKSVWTDHTTKALIQEEFFSMQAICAMTAEVIAGFTTCLHSQQ